MKNLSGSFTKLCLFSLLVGSLLTYGCGESNPTSSTTDSTLTTTQPTAVETSKTFRVWGRISCDGNQVANNISITLTNRGTNEYYSATEKTGYVFETVVSGVYELRAEGAGYDPYVTFQEFTEEKQIDISLQRASNAEAIVIPKINFQGSIIDNIGKAVPFTTIKAEKEGAEPVIASTEFNGDKYCLLGLSSGTYNVTFTNSSFIEQILKLEIKEDYIAFNGERIEKEEFTTKIINFKDAADNSYQGYKLSTLIMNPNVLETGSIAGTLCRDTNPVPQGTIVDLYRRKGNDIHNKLDFVMSLKAGVNGYFYAKNLQEGFYTVVDDGNEVKIETDSNGQVYYFEPGTFYFEDIEVKANFMTPVPSDEQ